ncbi:tripartite tricarboxylate transporter TctB family protein [Evansella sp. LMS18]|uniref:tripartite tricarboxylate transporter TctB family protein n=1 Tax=Evansella sp. LMS18 TaxID=2924033 RepID=UPI0020D0ADD7|nr:tripartite tricarboxylate transporter TctB family protein [Evansella sp. LMS18]UTR12107.1 tripartite tricarboxylate transporter TctB family protein [Evansella sp. LMS18]
MNRDRIFSICILLFCGLMYMETFNFARGSDLRAGPEVFPRILIGLIAALALIHLIKSFIIKEEKIRQSFNRKEFLGKYWKIIAMFMIFGLYTLFLPILSFITASLIFLFAGQALLMGLRKKKLIITNLAVTFAATFFVYFIFTETLNIWLP